jgi:16S rRNA (guanine527-N7)-methyltransferase
VYNDQQRILSGAQELGIALSDQQAVALAQYLDILEVTNRSFNLTRIPREEYAVLHVLDSLVALTAIPKRNGLRILDIGTGAGFPGVPLAAALPDARVTLVDSTLKKVRFAAESAEQCGIKNCEGLHQRAESLAKDPRHRGRYDVVVSRAVASFDTLIQWMAPFVSSGGYAIALKGAKVHEEIKGTEELVKQLRCSPPVVQTATLPGTDIERYLIVVQKN